MDSVSIELWLDKRQLAALEQALTEDGTTVERTMQEQLNELYAQRVPLEQQEKIQQALDAERLESQRNAEASARYAGLHITENGQEHYLSTKSGQEFLDKKNYGAEGAEVIVDNCQVNLYGGFAPASQTAVELSKALGSRTVMSGSISRGKNDPSQSLQMIERPLMTPDELKSMPKGSFIVAKTGVHPMKVKLRLFLDWGIRFGEPYEVPEKAQRAVAYASARMRGSPLCAQLTMLPDECERSSLALDAAMRM